MLQTKPIKRQCILLQVALFCPAGIFTLLSNHQKHGIRLSEGCKYYGAQQGVSKYEQALVKSLRISMFTIFI